MSSYKALLNSIANDSTLRELTEDEVRKLREVLLTAFQDLEACCEKHGLTVMLAGGSALGAVRHHGFIPWDDDLDVVMPRKDFETLKGVFEQELGEKYILSAPNYKNNARSRFPVILVKDTLLVELGGNPEDETSKIKIDIFILENIPKNIICRYIKGLWCTCLMFMASYEATYEHNTPAFRNYLCGTAAGRREYWRRMLLGRLFSFFRFQKWVDIVDSALQYRKESSLMGIPSGRKHYFGEILPRSTFLPPSKGIFEGVSVALPGNTDNYLSNLYGTNYMTLPPVEKRERHFILDIGFKEAVPFSPLKSVK